ncbi:MAG: OsmC family protein [Candidatus Aminicenantes bacterium]|nr:OsmC family protein [Candidatus Aminicenantes bacterium]
MAESERYETTVIWTGGHKGRLKLGNGPEMEFSAPPGSHGESGVLTPEDAFVGAINTCVMLMFIWAAERFRLDLVSYECRAEGTKHIELDRTEIFTRVVLRPLIAVRAGIGSSGAVEKRVRRALESAQKFSLVANSVKAEVVVEPDIVIEPGT